MRKKKSVCNRCRLPPLSPMTRTQITQRVHLIRIEYTPPLQGGSLRSEKLRIREALLPGSVASIWSDVPGEIGFKGRRKSIVSEIAFERLVMITAPWRGLQRHHSATGNGRTDIPGRHTLYFFFGRPLVKINIHKNVLALFRKGFLSILIGASLRSEQKFIILGAVMSHSTHLGAF